jgi:hypothetical protein
MLRQYVMSVLMYTLMKSRVLSKGAGSAWARARSARPRKVLNHLILRLHPRTLPKPFQKHPRRLSLALIRLPLWCGDSTYLTTITPDHPSTCPGLQGFLFSQKLPRGFVTVIVIVLLLVIIIPRVPG